MQNIHTSHAPLSLPPQLTALLPAQLCDAVRRCGAPNAEELRLHCGRTCTVTARGRNYDTGVVLTEVQMRELLKKMCGGSLYAFSQTINRGYLTLSGGIRVGICGTAATEDGRVIGVSEVTGLIIRIPHAVSVDVSPVTARLCGIQAPGGVLVFAPPGVGKTTLLRAVAEEIASPAYARRTVVVDTRRELGCTLNGKDLTLDILVGYPREIGIEIAVRSLGAQLVICDEIGSAEDARAILAAANCGVPLLASAHASVLTELLCRPAIRELHRARVFGTYVGLERDTGGFRYRFYQASDADRLLSAGAPL